jgi:hypothetical protein
VPSASNAQASTIVSLPNDLSTQQSMPNASTAQEGSVASVPNTSSVQENTVRMTSGDLINAIVEDYITEGGRPPTSVATPAVTASTGTNTATEQTGEWSSAEQQFNREWDALADQVEREEVMKALTTDDDNRKTPVQQNAILEDQLELAVKVIYFLCLPVQVCSLIACTYLRICRY